MSKIDLNLHDNFDQVFIKSGEIFFPLFSKFEMTANQITLLSYIPSFLTVYYLIQKEYHLAAIMYLFQYVMDCWDGHYARMYNQETDLGDKLDHYRDITLNLIVLYFLYNNWNYTKYHLILLIIIVSSFFVHYNCINKFYAFDKPNDKDVLKPMENICYENNKNGVVKLLERTRFLGNGTLVLYVSYLIWNLKNK